jgi:hypothetical protein
MLNLLRRTERTFEIYSAIYELFMAQTKDREDWLHFLIFNCELWLSCESHSISRILNHWTTIVVPQITTQRYFRPFLMQFERPEYRDLHNVNRVLYLKFLKILGFRGLKTH